jgi:RHS repeat-associated protein
LAAVKTLGEPTGLTTAFTYDFNASVPNPFAGSGIGPHSNSLRPNGVNLAQSTATGAPTRRQKWTWDTSVSTEMAVVYGDTFDAGGSYAREIRSVFYGSSYALSNGVPVYSVVRDGASGTIYQRTDWTYGVAGTDGSLTPPQTTTVSYPNAPAPSSITPTRVVTNGFGNSGLSVLWTTVAAAPAGSGAGTSGTVLQKTSYTYDYLPGKLDPSRLRTTTVTNYASDGVTALTPAPPVQKVEFDNGTTTGPGLTTRKYADAGALGQMGKTTVWDAANGRPTQVATFNSAYSVGIINRQEFGWDSASAHLSTLTTTYAAALGSAATSAMARTYDLSGYDSLDRPQKVTDERGVVSNVVYDTYGRLVSRTIAGQPQLGYSYSADTLTMTSTEGSRTSTVVRDPYGHTLSTTRPDGTRMSNTFDSLGRLQTAGIISNLGTSQTPAAFTYDLLDRITRSVNPGGRGVAVNTSYGTAGSLLTRTTRTVDPTGVNAVSTVDTNGIGQTVASADPKGTTISYMLNGLGKASQVTINDTANGLTQYRYFTFDAWGRLTSRNEPETGAASFSNWDALNHPQSITENGQRTQTFRFDGLGRLLTQVGGSESLSNTYTQADLTSATSVSNGQTINQFFTYNGPGKQMDSETTVIGSATFPITYGYDASLGHLNSMTYPSGRSVGYTYDSLERVQGVTYNGAPVLSTASLPTYNEWGQRQRLTFASSAYDHWTTKDGGTHLDAWAIGYASGGGTDSSNPRVYGYDSAERLSQAGEWSSLAHDSLSRLISADAPALGISSTFGQDGYSNNITHASTGSASAFVNNFSLGPQVGNKVPPLTLSGQSTGWAYAGPANEATSFSVSVGSGSSVGLSWDGLGRLRMASLPGVSVLTNTYAPSGMRVIASDSSNPGNSRYYVYTRGGQLLGEYTVSGGNPVWRRDVVYLDGGAIAEADAAGVHELHKDHLGTPRVITNGATGLIEGKQAYAAYGERIQTDTYIPLIGYTGHLQADPTGLIYMRGRFYSPAWHVFVNSDQGVDPNGWNQRAYVGGSPFISRDPSGLAIQIPEDDAQFWKSYNTMLFMAASAGGIRGSNGSVGNSGAESIQSFYGSLFGEIADFFGFGAEGYLDSVTLDFSEAVISSSPIPPSSNTSQVAQIYPVYVWDYTPIFGIPHTFIQTPNMTRGFKPIELYHYRAAVWTVPGYVANDEGHPHNEYPTQTFYVDASTLTVLEQNMSWDPGRYELNNGFWHNGAFNCTGWANRVLSNSGLGGSWSGVFANPYTN